jgi:ketosteroid isomerase-like protein
MSEIDDRERSPVEVVQHGVAAFQRGDLEEVVALGHDDFEIFLPPDLPNSGRYVGRDGFFTWVEQWLDAWEDFTVEITEVQPVGERHVVARMRQSGRGKGSGIPVDMEIAYMWEVADGRFAALHLYASPEEAVQVAERRERESPDGNRSPA